MSLANKITIARILAVPLFIVSVLYYTPEKDYLRFVALGIFCLAAVSDALDGYLARARNEITLAGQILDPLADKALLISAFICLYRVGVYFPRFHFPKWLVIALISRDVILILGSGVVHLIQREFRAAVTVWGKATTVLSMLCVVTVLLQIPYSYIIWYVTGVVAAVSLLDYLIRGVRTLNP